MIVLRWRSAGAAVRRPALGIFRVIVGTLIICTSATWTCLLGESELLLAEADEDCAAEEVAVEGGEVLGEAAGAGERGQQQGAHTGRVTVWGATVEAINILTARIYSLLYCPHAVRW